MSKKDGIAVWCRDCKYYYNSIESNGCVCTNPDSNWVADFPDEYCSCEYCERKTEDE